MPKNLDIQALFEKQASKLGEDHFLILWWAANAQDKKIKYNITNGFDDLKAAGLTRTKQTAVAVIEALEALCFIDVRDEGNRRNIYISDYGAQALMLLTSKQIYTTKPSAFMEGR